MRIVIVAPGNYYSGGPEALHQLEHSLRGAGVSAGVMYRGPKSSSIVTDFKNRYMTNEVEHVLPDDYVVIPEIYDPGEYIAKCARLIVWWLSDQMHFAVDKYRDCWHIFQSIYVKRKFESIGFHGLLVTDYIRKDCIQRPVREIHGGLPVIAFNYRSAYLMARASDFGINAKLQLISGADYSTTCAMLENSNFYFDIGWHPGRDRMLREAALLGCSVLANEINAADGADVPLNDYCRLRKTRPNELASEINIKLRNWRLESAEHHKFVNWIQGQEACFNKEVIELVRKCNNMQNVGETATLYDFKGQYALSLLESEKRRLRDNIADAGIQLCSKRNTYKIRHRFAIFRNKIKSFIKA